MTWPWLTAAFAAYSLLAAASRVGPVEWPLYYATWAVGWLAFAALWRSTAREPHAVHPRQVAAAFLLLRLPGLAARPVWEDDFYRHLWDGWLTTQRGTPYGLAPSEFFATPNLPEPIARLLDGINHPDLPTVYGPGLQAAFALAAALRPGSLLALQLLLLLAEAATLLAVHRLAGPRAALLAAACPLAILELTFNAHPEALALAPCLWAMHAHAHGHDRRAALLLGLAAAGRPFALLLAPFLLRRSGLRGVGWMSAALALAYLPFLLAGHGATDLLPLAAFAAGWEFNSTGHALLTALAGPTLGRALAAFALLAFLGWSWQRSTAAHPPPGDMLFLALLVCAPVANPWYFVWLVPFAAQRPARWPWAVCAVASLAHLHGLNVPALHLPPYAHPDWLRPLAVALVLAAWRFDPTRRALP